MPSNIDVTPRILNPVVGGSNRNVGINRNIDQLANVVGHISMDDGSWRNDLLPIEGQGHLTKSLMMVHQKLTEHDVPQSN